MNTGRPKGNQKHLDLSARIIIEQHLNNGDSFRSIAIELSKDPSTISKEIRRHSIIRERSADAFAPIPCANNYDSSKPRTNICNVMHMCGDNECRRKCVLCRKFRCSDVCKFYKPRECEKLNKPPYVCNGCSKRTNCMMDKKIYSSKYAQDSYEALRTTSREGINQTPESIQKLDNLLSPLLKKGQSIAHIYASHADEIACSRRTIYSYIDRGVFQARNIDLRRKVVYKQRKRKTTTSLKDRSFRKGRSYKEFLEYIAANKSVYVVEMDTVEGAKGTSPCFLTMFFRNCTQAYFCGKPNPLMMRTGLNMLGCHSAEAVMVGDRMDTDVISGMESGMSTVLVLSGCSTKDTLKTYAYLPTMVLNGVGDIASMAKAKEE